MYLVINWWQVLVKGLIGALVGIGTAGFFLAIKYFVWKDKVPNWISKFRWIIGFLLGVITCYIYYELGGDINSGTLVIAAVCLGIGYTFKNETPIVELTEDEKEQFIVHELKEIGIINFTKGSHGNISDNLTYRIVKIDERSTFMDKMLFEFNIEFSDLKVGDLYYSKSDKSFFIKPGIRRIYYVSKEAAINGLYFYLCNKKLLEDGRQYISI